MKCKECVAAGKKSRLYVGESYTNLVYVKPFYDEDGKYHSHGGNTSTINYSCSNGHKYQEQTKKRNMCCDVPEAPTPPSADMDPTIVLRSW